MGGSVQFKLGVPRPAAYPVPQGGGMVGGGWKWMRAVKIDECDPNGVFQ